MSINHIVATDGELCLESIKQFVADCEQVGVAPRRRVKVRHPGPQDGDGDYYLEVDTL